MNKIDLIKNFVKGATNLKGSNLYTRTNEKLGITRLVNYNTTIAVYDHIRNRVYLNSTKYSMTTSLNQNYIRKYSDNYILRELSYEELYDYLEKLPILRQIEHILRNIYE